MWDDSELAPLQLACHVYGLQASVINQQDDGSAFKPIVLISRAAAWRALTALVLFL